MKKIIVVSVICIAIIMFCFSLFYEDDRLRLYQVEIPGNARIDTLERNEKEGIYLTNVTRLKALGKLEFYMAIIKRMPGHKDLVYKIDDTKKSIRLSNEYIALVKEEGKASWGWFFINDGKVLSELPDINKILDSIKITFSKEVFVTETNGYIQIVSNSQKSKLINYGNLMTNCRSLNFDTLPYALYKYQADTVIAYSGDPETIFKQKSGLFFVPPPGLGVIKKYKKSEVYRIIDSLSGLSSVPGTIRVKPV